MNRKRTLLILALALAAIAAVALFVLFGRDAAPGEGPGERPGVSVFPSGTSTAPARPDGGSSTSSPAQPGAAEAPAAVQGCFGEPSAIERNGCIAAAAAETRDPGLCAYVSGSLAKAGCMNGVAAKPIELPKPSTSYQDILTTVYERPAVRATSTVTYNPASVSELPTAKEDPRLTSEAFVERFASGAELKVYALSQYQAKPGETVYVYGTGFVYPNTLLVGSNSIQNLRSEDGASLSFAAPSASGEYEISVSNSKGTSAGTRPKLVVTDNPTPRPKVTGASPSVVDLSGEVTLTGVGFTQNNSVSTTLGVLNNVSASGNSVRFRIVDLPVVSQVKDLKEVKGKKLGVGVYVANENGFSADLFYFDVQF